MKRLGGFLLMVLVALTFLGCAVAADADKPVGGVKSREILQENGDIAGNSSSGFRKMLGGFWTLDGPDSCVTGKKYTWTANPLFGDEEYEFYMCVLDGSYPDSRVADVQYDVYQISRKLSYTFYFPGTYVLFVDFHDDNLKKYVWATDAITIHVADGGQNAVTSKIKQVAKENKTNDEFQTVKNLHDWLLDNCTYDTTYTYYSADSIFRLGTGVCNSYSRAFTLLLKECGIDSRRVTGYAFGNPDSGHAWNAVKIYGKWYLFDLTWDDSGNTQDEFRRNLYFAVPEKVFSMEHTARKYVGGNVKCKSWTDNYFIHTGTWETYALDTLEEYREWQDGGLHRFWLEPPQICGNDSYNKAVLGNVTAYELTLTPYPDTSGRALSGTFEYNDVIEEIVGKHNHLGTLTLPEGMTTVPEELFTSSAATCVVLPETCTSIGRGAFDGMDLWEIHVPASVPYSDLEEAFDENPESYILIIAPAGSDAVRFAADHGNRFFYMYY